ncbi:MAG: hypothetical protein CVU95_09580 [Firmicutes bacterium HGW-Firmicutes-2]|jgi:TRAP-type C4-dicarboxylate transport system permease small subunit|nr:MAG: hypothetical protein CVU95_09580 [Firmicutes bacterium HGW-Firmicutes-2]
MAMKWIYKTRKALDGLIIIIFILMFSIVTINVIARYFFNNPIPWAGELSRYSFIAIIYLGAILAFRDKGHIGLDIIVDYFPEKLKKIIEGVSKLLVGIFLVVFIYVSLKTALNNINTKSSAMLISMAVPYLALPIGGLGMLCELIIDVLKIEEKSKEVEL